VKTDHAAKGKLALFTTKDAEMFRTVSVRYSRVNGEYTKTVVSDPDPSLIERIAQRLAERIPAPYVPPPVPQASWRTLKPGQFLRNRNSIHTLATGSVSPGAGLWEVRACDSGGVVLALQLTGLASSATLRWERSDWETEWERIRKPGKRKAKAKAGG